MAFHLLISTRVIKVRIPRPYTAHQYIICNDIYALTQVNYTLREERALAQGAQMLLSVTLSLVMVRPTFYNLYHITYSVYIFCILYCVYDVMQPSLLCAISYTLTPKSPPHPSLRLIPTGDPVCVQWYVHRCGPLRPLRPAGGLPGNTTAILAIFCTQFPSSYVYALQ